MKAIIAGSRTFDDYPFLRHTVDIIREEIDITEIVSGHAEGADQLGELYAHEHKIPVKIFPAEWNKFATMNREEALAYAEQNHIPRTMFPLDWDDYTYIRKRNLAGLARNMEMAYHADALIAFDMGTTGTGHMINQMFNLDKIVYIKNVGHPIYQAQSRGRMVQRTFRDIMENREY